MIKNCNKCDKEFTSLPPSQSVKVDIRNRKYCWDCSPYGLGNRKPLDLSKSKICSKCNENKPIDCFYTKSSTSHRTRTPYCKSCTLKYKYERELKLKIEMVKYKGGKCEDCDYNKNLAALDFHHIESEEKDFNLAHNSSNLNKVKSELDKCILLCSNCHRERHHPDKNYLLN